MFLRIATKIKCFALVMFLISFSISGIGNTQNIINQLLTTTRENKGKIFVLSGIIITGWFGYQYRSSIKQYLNSCKASINKWLLANVAINSNPDLSDIRPPHAKEAWPAITSK